MNNYPIIHPGLTWRLLDGEAVIVSPVTGEIRVLNQVGAEIWQMVANDFTFAQIVSAITKQYGLSAKEAESDLSNFLVDLEDRGLISWQK
ncbi:MAG: hypothetical protein CSB13_07040 [Chloroflexi bacterium]|nr:MAG: hypothetical protein CSB13_07040 [Chloroflexota bacterium]